MDRYWAIVLALSLLFGVLSSMYQVFLAAPAVVAARPELANLGLWTAAFSGRFESWLFYHHPVAGTIGTVLSCLVGGIILGAVFKL